MWKGTFEYKTSLVMFCEGLADKNFLRQLITIRGLPTFDYPYPVTKEDDCISEKAKKLHSRDQFGNMLQALDSALDLKPELRNQLKGVLIVTDAGDDPSRSFRNVRNQITRVRHFGEPTEPMNIVRGNSGRPSISVMLLPQAGKRSLETVCLREMKAKMRPVYDAMQIYLRTKPIKAIKWKSEKRDKARLRCMIAATNEKDPTVSLQWAFSENEPIIDVKAQCFRNIYKDIKKFCEAVGVP